MAVIAFCDTIRHTSIVTTVCLVGNAMGAMQVSLARKSYRLILTTEFTMFFVLMTALTLFRKEIALFYAPNDEELRDLLTTLLPLVGILM